MFYQSIDNLWTKKIITLLNAHLHRPIKRGVTKILIFSFKMYVPSIYSSQMLLLPFSIEEVKCNELNKKGEGQICVLVNTPNSS